MSAPRGGLGDENLDVLLVVRQDGIYHPMDVRKDIATLVRAGDFAQVEAWVESWPTVLLNGQEIEGVRVEYRVYATPVVRRVAAIGVRSLPLAEVLAASGAVRGEPWREDDPAKVADRIEAFYRSNGFLATECVVQAEYDDEGDVSLDVRVDEGPPQRLVELRVRPNPALSEAGVKKLLAREGVAVGRPYTAERLRRAQDAIQAELRDYEGSFLWWTPTWWPEARLNLKLVPAEGGDRLSVLIEPRRRYTIEPDDHTQARRLPRAEELVDAMGMEDGARLGRDFGAEASLALTDAERRRGYLDAAIEVWAREGEESVNLTIGGERGPRYALAAVEARGQVVDPAETGASAVSLALGSVFSGCRAASPVDAAHGASARFLCQAAAESAREVVPTPMFARQTLTPEVADRAVDDLEDFYRSQGYLDVEVQRVGFAAEPGERRRHVTLSLEVKAGPRVRLEAVDVVGGVPGVDSDKLFRDLVGKPLDPAALRERTRRLVDAHMDLGHLYADAQSVTGRDPGGEGATVTVNMVPGPVVLVRSTLLKGSVRTRRALVEGEIDVLPGDAVSPAELVAVRRRLYELGVFQRASVEAVGDEDRVKDVVVAVEEKKNLAFEVGGGIATDDGAAVFARAGHRNLWGLAHRLTLYGKVGVGWVGDGWTPDWLAPEWKAAARYEAPNLPTRGELVALDVLFNEQSQEAAYRLYRSGAGASVRLALGAGVSAELGYRAQYRTLYDIDPGVLVAGDAWLQELGVDDVSDPSPLLPSAGRWASAIEGSVVIDLRDDVANPTRGGLGSVTFIVNEDVLSDIAFARAEGVWTQLFPVSGLGVLLRGRAGAALVPDEQSLALPIEERLSAGGGGSFRGFDVDSVGPANYVSSEDVAYPEALDPLLRWSDRDAAGRWVTTGGDALAIATAELDVPFPRLGLSSWRSWQLALFTDVGNVWWSNPAVVTDSMALGTDPLLRYGVGVGIRRVTPIGPLQLDLGFNPSPLAYRDEELVRVHFAVGAL